MNVRQVDFCVFLRLFEQTRELLKISLTIFLNFINEQSPFEQARHGRSLKGESLFKKGLFSKSAFSIRQIQLLRIL